jgi:C-methyltransferase-like protein/putative zinc binding protein/methyltransferase family protein
MESSPGASVLRAIQQARIAERAVGTGAIQVERTVTESGCRFCSAKLEHTVVDLGMSPLCESFIAADQLNHMEAFYPLRVYVCSDCFLVQLEEYVSPSAIFGDYAYFSSYSDTWLEHARRYTSTMVEQFGLTKDSQVIEIASNDGYLLQYFVERGIPALGIEPAANVAEVALNKGIPTLVQFFGRQVAEQLSGQGTRADLLIGNNVLAQVPDLDDFVGGMKILLAPDGIVTMEFPHLLRLIEGNQFDTIYHEHFSYFSFTTVERIFAAHGLALFDVEELPTHGGSLRIYGCHTGNRARTAGQGVRQLLDMERDAGLTRIDYYQAFTERVQETKRGLLEFLIQARREGKRVAGYGAPGKGNTLLNYCGIRTDFLDFTVDRSPHKQGKYLPGTHIPIFSPDMIRQTRPDYVLILPWNVKDEIMEQMSYIRAWGGRFVAAIPRLQVFP